MRASEFEACLTAVLKQWADAQAAGDVRPPVTEYILLDDPIAFAESHQDRDAGRGFLTTIVRSVVKYPMRGIRAQLDKVI